ncbi:MAG: TlpA family protein disulfide reductase [Magnetospirillum sp.]|nr:TlpA family protein disulfide reductase [Magnetospirillum sp.]
MSRRLFIAAIILALLAPVLAARAAAAEIQPFGRDGWQGLTAAHAGRALVVHFWSLTCAPCIAEMPEWAKLARRSRSFDLVLVATDPIEETPRLAAALKQWGLDGVESWAFADRFTEKLRYAVDPHWHGELPMTRLVAADGAGQTVIGSLRSSGLGDRLAGHGR